MTDVSSRTVDRGTGPVLAPPVQGSVVIPEMMIRANRVERNSERPVETWASPQCTPGKGSGGVEG